MPRDVIPQVDVGALTLNGLAAFSPLIAALSTDNVSPMAMIQLQSLGDLFHTSGRYAARVPDLLQRCSSVPLDQLGMAIGWRKGDAASLMAQSAGGQAIALLCFCLVNLYPRESGDILFELSRNVLRRDLAISSIAQLADVSQLLDGKLSALGFGNILAEQVLYIHKVFEQLEESVPSDFLHSISRDSMVDLLSALSRAFREEEILVRISGSQGMGYIVALAAILFPMDTTLIIGSFIIREGTSKLIFLELDKTADSGCPTQIRVEKVLKTETPDSLPINIVSEEAPRPPSSYYFEWTGHVADWLFIRFAEMGVTCTSALLVACCDVLLLLPHLVQVSWVDSPRLNMFSLLGPEPMQRIYHVCRVVFREVPSGQFKDLKSAYRNLVQSFIGCAGVKSQCTCGKCDLHKGWKTVERQYNCATRNLWRCIGKALSGGFWYFYVHAQEHATLAPDESYCDLEYNVVLDTIYGEIFKVGRPIEYPGQRIHHYLMELVQGRDIELAHSNRSSTICPASLLQLKRGLDEGVRYELKDGRMLVDGRYYRSLLSTSVEVRPRASKSLYQRKGHITPTSLGEHSNLVFTIREFSSGLELRTTAICNGQSLHLNLLDIIISSLVVQIAAPCEHGPGCLLDEEYSKDVFTTSIAGPLADGKKIAITQTRDNPVAQLLACEAGIPLLQRDCCLNCAFKQAKEHNYSQIIVM
ncbi:hypothetical protein EPUS_06616 [Endocarpon pusillum Z07020]|uniref:Uncharacterized protein n=1 Tax=Endocarpon pusillum (strain Z07020 / HMAS-L-300199) TaxID=1263415 RepID=U1GQ27_ENDPU|nr:uncharacterized protein EPUS_06616 [Endocarpon pusillum Z07020]ERF74438.1 hypothetical protein EPUS_06616 [Endocarpon pusillum Z07020]